MLQACTISQPKLARPMSAFAVREAKKANVGATPLVQQEQLTSRNVLPKTQLPRGQKHQPSPAISKSAPKRDAFLAALDEEDQPSKSLKDERPAPAKKRSLQKSGAGVQMHQTPSEEIRAAAGSSSTSGSLVASSSASPQLPARHQSVGGSGDGGCAQLAAKAAASPTRTVGGNGEMTSKRKATPGVIRKTKKTADEAAAEAAALAEEQAAQAATADAPRERRKLARMKGPPELLEAADGIDSDSGSVCGPVEFTDSETDAKSLFAKLIHPMLIQEFFDKHWCKTPTVIRRKDSAYYREDDWFSTSELDRILRTEDLQFGINVDVTTYENGERETHNPSGRAHAAVVWDMYQTGCSVRLLNPQTYSEQTWRLLATLQELFGSGMGANTYLTPPGSQGFAPHYDDIEAFVLQLEGRKHWRIYNSCDPSQKLPRVSSGNFKQEVLGEPVLDVTLSPGDLLYFPRGYIHQANTVEGYHSLHMTISTHQKNTYADLLEKLLPAALERAVRSDSKYRESLPTNYLSYTGAAWGNEDSHGRKKFALKLRLLFKDIFNYFPVDEVCDQLGKRFVQECMPPYLTNSESQCSIYGSGEHWNSTGETVQGSFELEPDTKVRLLRKHILRMVPEPVESTSKGSGDAMLRLYHSANNSRIYLGREPQYIEASSKVAPAIMYLLKSYPAFVAVDSLPLGTIEDKMEVIIALYDAGVLVTETCLSSEDGSWVNTDDDDGDEDLSSGDSETGSSDDDGEKASEDGDSEKASEDDDSEKASEDDDSEKASEDDDGEKASEDDDGENAS